MQTSARKDYEPSGEEQIWGKADQWFLLFLVAAENVPLNLRSGKQEACKLCNKLQWP